VRYHGTHQPIIEKGLFLRAQEVIEANRRKARKKHVVRWAYQGLVRCGDCTGIMSADRKKRRFVYYHCSGGVRRCESRAYVREEILDGAFEAVLARLRLPEDVAQAFRNSLETSSEERDATKAAQLHDLRTQLALLTKRLDLLYRDRLDRVITAEAYKTYKSEIERQCDAIEAEMLAVSEMNGGALRRGTEILELTGSLADRFKNAEPQEKQLCLVATLSNSVWKDGKLEAAFRQPLDAIAVAATLAQKKNGKSLSKSAVDPVWYSQRDSNPCFHRERVAT
jgi:site-specific DNA recombinase